MQPSFDEIRQMAHALPEEQRIELANSLYESVDPSEANEAEFDAAWGDEIKRRLDEVDSGAVQMVPLEDVLARMEARRRARQQG